MNVVGPREFIHTVLSENDGEVSVSEIRGLAISGEYHIAGTFLPITADGMLSFQCIEEVIQDMCLRGEAVINDGVLSLIGGD